MVPNKAAMMPKVAPDKKARFHVILRRAGGAVRATLGFGSGDLNAGELD